MNNILKEMPHVIGIKCPNCDTGLEIDAQMEKWPLSRELKTSLTKEYFKIKILPLTCPECEQDLLYFDQLKKTYLYNKIIDKIKPTAKKFVELVKQFVNDMRIEYSLTDSLTFKRFSHNSDIIKQLVEDEQKFSTIKNPLKGFWILPNNVLVNVDFSGHYRYVKNHPEDFNLDPEMFKDVVNHSEVMNMAYRQGGVHVFLDPERSMEISGLNKNIILQHINIFDKLQKEYKIPISKILVSMIGGTFNIVSLRELLQDNVNFLNYSKKLDILDENDTNYRIDHTAPINNGYNAPLYDLTKIFSDDVYSFDSARIYGHFGHNDPMDVQTMSIIKYMRNKPNRAIRIYRAVPNFNIDVENKIKMYNKILSYVYKFGFTPIGHSISNEIPENIKFDKNEIINYLTTKIKTLEKEKKPKLTINVGDWVTINKQYAINHGKAEFDSYKILSKVVKAKDLYTNGDSIHEWGYDPQSNNTKTIGENKTLKEDIQSLEAYWITPNNKVINIGFSNHLFYAKSNSKIFGLSSEMVDKMSYRELIDNCLKNGAIKLFVDITYKNMEINANNLKDIENKIIEILTIMRKYGISKEEVYCKTIVDGETYNLFEVI